MTNRKFKKNKYYEFTMQGGLSGVCKVIGVVEKGVDGQDDLIECGLVHCSPIPRSEAEDNGWTGILINSEIGKEIGFDEAWGTENQPF